MRSQWPVALFVVLFVLSSSLQAQPAATSQVADLSAIRAQIDALRADYEKKIQDLQKQLDEVQAQVNRAPALATSTSVTGGSVSASKVFNPDISVIGDFLGAAGSNKVRRPISSQAITHARTGRLSSRATSRTIVRESQCVDVQLGRTREQNG